jgi:transcriptional regulator GlxA family with amidase domain
MRSLRRLEIVLPSVVVALVLLWSSVPRRVGASPAPADPLKLPATGKIPVAFVVSEGAVVIDFAGPWAVFESVRDSPFQLYLVAETAQPIRASSGMKIVPDYTFANAPRPKIIVIPAQQARGSAVLQWIQKMTETADLTFSVCNGAFLLAETGLLTGNVATAHHDSYRAFERQFPNVRLERGARFTEEGKLATAGGLSSGIDLALRVVERYFGRATAEQTAYDLEYQGKGWTDPHSNAAYLRPKAGAEDPICGMIVDEKTSPFSVYKGKTYYFCSGAEKTSFDKHPERYVRNQ